MKDIILIGGFVETIELCENNGFKIVGIVDNHAESCYGYSYLGDDAVFLSTKEKYQNIPLLIVPDNPYARENIYNKYISEGFRFESVISDKSIISKRADIGESVMISSGCNVSANAFIRTGVRINSFANVMHDSSIGEFSVIAPNAVILGGCDIGDRTYIGANATILPGIRIGDDVVIGAGAVVTKDVKSLGKVAGNPARYL